MTGGPLDGIRAWIETPQDALRWACVLEATAPKVGNVFPGRSFQDLNFVDFIKAAEITAERLTRSNVSITGRMLDAVQANVDAARTNVNLGIILLLGPLVAADQTSRFEGRVLSFWGDAIAGVLDSFGPQDGRNVFDAIGRAGAGGLDRPVADHLDVHQTIGPVDIIEAMRDAADHDRIARQYASGFSDLIDNVVPIVDRDIRQAGDVLAGIGRAQLTLLGAEPDSLIARKNGLEVARDLQQRVAQTRFDPSSSIVELDRSIRSDNHSLNPGTTADLIAASLYILLRTDP